MRPWPVFEITKLEWKTRRSRGNSESPFEFRRKVSPELHGMSGSSKPSQILKPGCLLSSPLARKFPAIFHAPPGHRAHPFPCQTAPSGTRYDCQRKSVEVVNLSSLADHQPASDHPHSVRISAFRDDASRMCGWCGGECVTVSLARLMMLSPTFSSSCRDLPRGDDSCALEGR